MTFAIISISRWERLPLFKILTEELSAILPNTIRTQIAFTSRKLGPLVHGHQHRKFANKSNILYSGTYPDENCSEIYGESARRVCDVINYHDGRDRCSHLSDIVPNKTINKTDVNRVYFRYLLLGFSLFNFIKKVHNWYDF